ncbi:MAG TPA: RtcB family protein [Acidobacteriota bacterium]|nr:RtcB family protein [Acidobacteriota bacterium]
MELLDAVQQVSETIWEVSTDYKEGMRVPARIIATEKLMQDMDDAVLEQITNVATLPGIVKYALCMPDAHSGYGFPIGGVAAMDPAQGGVISPGGIGFDINCGMRLVRTNLTLSEVEPRIEELVDRLFERIPAGVGSSGALKVSESEFKELVVQGARWCVNQGYGWEEDLELTEEKGCIAGADPSKISERAIKRGLNQVGTLGSGNHYLEVQVLHPENIVNHETAKAFGLDIPEQIVVMFHCGSRGFGHQVATDYLQLFLKVMGPKYGIQLRDRELACAPFNSPEGQDYFAAMKCGLNMSFANRQVITHHVRKTFEEVFGRSAEDMGMHMIYDVSHNTAKLERHTVDGEERELLVHRKGATRAFAPGMPDVPERYQDLGQPVIIGGSMETGSYLLLGVESGREAFYSTAHGSGRTMSRTKARKLWRGDKLQRELKHRGIYIRTASYSGLAEEAGGAYKSIDEVVDATARAGLSTPVARFIPIGNVKG